MTTSPTTTEPVNPLTGELATITVVDRRYPSGVGEVQGRVVVAGLALVPTPKDSPKEPNRYALTHIGTGLAVIPGTCGVHALQAAEKAISVGADWTIASQESMVREIKAIDAFMEVLTSIRFACSPRWCTTGDGPEPSSWSARCLTCSWEWSEEEDDDWPLTREEAAAKAAAHSCGPEVELRSPETGSWAHPWNFEPNEDQGA